MCPVLRVEVEFSEEYCANEAWREMHEDSKDKLTKLVQAEIDRHNENERQIAEDEALKLNSKPEV